MQTLPPTGCDTKHNRNIHKHKNLPQVQIYIIQITHIWKENSACRFKDSKMQLKAHGVNL